MGAPCASSSLPGRGLLLTCPWMPAAAGQGDPVPPEASTRSPDQRPADGRAGAGRGPVPDAQPREAAPGEEPRRRGRHRLGHPHPIDATNPANQSGLAAWDRRRPTRPARSVPATTSRWSTPRSPSTTGPARAQLPDRPRQLRRPAHQLPLRPADRLGPAGWSLVYAPRLRRRLAELPRVRLVQDRQPDSAAELDGRRQLVPLLAGDRIRDRRLPEAGHERRAHGDREQRLSGEQLPHREDLGLRAAARRGSELHRPLPGSRSGPRRALAERRRGSRLHARPAQASDGGPNAYVTAADYPELGTASQMMVWHVSGGGGGAPPSLERRQRQRRELHFPLNVPQPGTTGARLDGHAPDAGLACPIRTLPGRRASGHSTRSTARAPRRCCAGTSSSRACATGPPAPPPRSSRQGPCRTPPLRLQRAISPTRNGQDAVVHYNLGSGSCWPRSAPVGMRRT